MQADVLPAVACGQSGRRIRPAAVQLQRHPSARANSGPSLSYQPGGLFHPIGPGCQSQRRLPIPHRRIEVRYPASAAKGVVTVRLRGWNVAPTAVKAK